MIREEEKLKIRLYLSHLCVPLVFVCMVLYVYARSSHERAWAQKKQNKPLWVKTKQNPTRVLILFLYILSSICMLETPLRELGPKKKENKPLWVKTKTRSNMDHPSNYNVILGRITLKQMKLSPQLIAWWCGSPWNIREGKSRELNHTIVRECYIAI